MPTQVLVQANPLAFQVMTRHDGDLDPSMFFVTERNEEERGTWYGEFTVQICLPRPPSGPGSGANAALEVTREELIQLARAILERFGET